MKYVPTAPSTLTEAQRERLVLLIEECTEVIQAATKTLRWGYDDYHPVTREINRNMLMLELCDVQTIIMLLVRAGDLDLLPRERQEKIVKLRRYTSHQPDEVLADVTPTW